MRNSRFRLALFFYTAFLCVVSGSPRTLKIAGIFDEKSSPQIRKTFEYAAHSINEGRGGSALPGTTLVSRTIRDFRPDLFTGPKTICDLAEEGTIAIFGAQREISTAFVASLADMTNIPYLTGRWKTSTKDLPMEVNLYPDHHTTSTALYDLIRHFNWTSFALIYDDADSLARASTLLDGTNKLKPDIFKLDRSDIKSTLRQVQSTGASFIVLDTPRPVAGEVLKVAKEMDMITFYYHYILSTWDIHLMDVVDYSSTFVNITSFQLIDIEDPRLIKVGNGARDGKEATSGKPVDITTDSCLMYDAVNLFAKAAKRVIGEKGDLGVNSVSCSRKQFWKHGLAFRDAILGTKLKGLTGDVSFGSQGKRKSVRLHVVEPLRTGLQKVGYWTAESGIQINFNYTGQRQSFQTSVRNRALKVLAKLESPYVMEKHNASLYEGNDRYRGFCVDLLSNLSATLNFSYELIVSDLPYGFQDPKTKEWHGLVRELIDKKGDMVLGATTITRDREEVVDFSQPFLYLGVRILLKRPEKKPPALFSFLDPLSLDVWIYILIAYLTMSLFLFFIGRFSPYEWYNPNPCIEEAGVVENQFSIFNATWFTIGSLMQVGTEIAPRAVSTRLLAGIWWFFTMIMVGSYTANLAAYLTAERMKLPIENAQDLVKQNQIKYGCFEGGATCKFFERSVYPDYMRMWDAIKADPSNFVQSHEEGVAKVKESTGSKGYAYLMESITLEYITSRDCNVIGIGNPLDTKGYGVAFPKNSPFRKEISVAILTQQDKGFLEEFRIKWWKKEDGGNTCEDVKASSGTNAMGLDMVGGVFVVVLLGIGLGIFVAIFEFSWKARRNPDVYKESLIKEMMKALKDAVRSPFTHSKSTIRSLNHGQFSGQDDNTAVPLPHNRKLFPSSFN